MSVLEYVGALVWPTFAVEQVGSEAGMTCMDLIVDLDLGRATKYHSVHIFLRRPGCMSLPTLGHVHLDQLPVLVERAPVLPLMIHSCYTSNSSRKVPSVVYLYATAKYRREITPSTCTSCTPYMPYE